LTSGSPPPQSLLITPDLRRRLQQRYEEAQRLAGRLPPDFRRIHELLAECVRADPGNILYLDALLANLRRRGAAGGDSWWQRWWRSRAGAKLNRPAAAAPYSILREMPDALWSRPRDIQRLRAGADAAGALEFDEIELRYLYAAREVEPDDVETLRMLARALTRQGRFEDALGPWCAVLALKSDDSEAGRAIEDLGAVRQVDPQLKANEHSRLSDAAALVRQAQVLQDAGDYVAAEECLARAQAASGGDLNVLILRENLRTGHSQQRLGIARRRAASDPHPRAQQLVQRLAAEHNRLESEILNARAERLPGDWTVRIELARRLKQAGNFSGAIQRLEEALRQKPDEPAALLELGECWQHLRQFAKALDLYERAAANPESSSEELQQLARYRAGVLAAALGQTEAARDHFRAVVAADAAYKDARERLDKLGPN
jgi:tetratricopeptide (TPR) repeat protein